MKYGLIGEHLGHSYSAEIHAFLGNPEYELQELAPKDLEPFLKKADFSGINVTIPYKEKVIPYLDSITRRAARIGAVNTIVRRGGKLIGDNTDYAGMQALLERIGIRSVRKALVLGTGGTSKTAHAVLEDSGTPEIITVSRSAGPGRMDYEEAAEQHGDTDLILNATPCGMFPEEDGIPVDPECFPVLRGIADAVYHPIRTNLVLEGIRHGIPSEGGLYMLAAQAVSAHGIFFAKEMPKESTELAFRKVRMQEQNIVLIGMPSCGKTTVGSVLARMTGKRLVDTDQVVEEMTGMRVSDFIVSYGEQAFREAERDAVQKCARLGGVILATGGGAVLRPDNVTALQRTGKVFFLDRSPEKLVCTDDRPLSSNPEKLLRMYRERLPIYRAAADCTISGDAEPETEAERIWKEFAG